MPFTFSHPAIILPLTYLPRKWFSLTGLVIGSLTPDFEYFLRMRIKSNYSHTLDGLFWFDLPLGILLAFIFHNLVRETLFDNLPGFLRSRFSIFTAFNWNDYFKRNAIVIIISILIGAASHILWDGFTHHDGYFVELFPSLTNTVDLFSLQTPIFKILQHSSTTIGGLAIAYVIYKLPVSKTLEGSVSSKYWITVSGLTLIIFSIRLLSGLELIQYGDVIASVISAVLLSLVMTPVILKRNRY